VSLLWVVAWTRVWNGAGISSTSWSTRLNRFLEVSELRMCLLPQLLEGLLPSRTVQAEKNLDSKAVIMHCIMHWYSSSIVWFTTS